MLVHKPCISVSLPHVSIMGYWGPFCGKRMSACALLLQMRTACPIHHNFLQVRSAGSQAVRESEIAGKRFLPCYGLPHTSEGHIHYIVFALNLFKPQSLLNLFLVETLFTKNLTSVTSAAHMITRPIRALNAFPRPSSTLAVIFPRSARNEF